MRSGWHAAGFVAQNVRASQVLSTAVLFSVQKRGVILGAAVTHSKLLVRLFVPDSPEFLHQFAFANLRIIPVHFASAILENLNFAVYVRESVCIRLIVHDVSPLTRILRLVRSQHRDLKVLAEGRTIIDGGTAC
jgi:hypothetical protein